MILATSYERNLFSASLTAETEKKIIRRLICQEFFADPVIQRPIATYYRARPSEKDELILELMKAFWERFSLVDFFNVFRDFDTVFVSMGKKGHFIHQFEVFLLGWCLISELLESRRWSDFEVNYSEPRDVFSIWLMSATVHDLGYPLEEAGGIIRNFRTLYRKLGMLRLADRYAEINREYNLEDEASLVRLDLDGNGPVDFVGLILGHVREELSISVSETKKIRNSLLKENNHGLISAVLLYRSCLEAFLKKRDWQGFKKSKLSDMLKLATTAITLHSLPKGLQHYIGEIRIEKNPFAYLLFLVDNLQEWSRSLRRSDKWVSYSLTDFASCEDTVKLSYLVRHRGWIGRIERDFLKSLSEKRKRIDLLRRPKTPVGFTVHVEVKTDHGMEIEPIQLRL